MENTHDQKHANYQATKISKKIEIHKMKPLFFSSTFCQPENLYRSLSGAGTSDAHMPIPHIFGHPCSQSQNGRAHQSVKTNEDVDSFEKKTIAQKSTKSHLRPHVP